MAKDTSSFDVVSEVDMVELANAIDQARREVATRFDFKNTDTHIDHDDTLVEVRSSTEDRLKAAVEVLTRTGDAAGAQRLNAEAARRFPGLVPKGDLVWYQAGTRLRPYGYPSGFVPNIVHQHILVLRAG